MITSVFHRRRAERFAELLDQSSGRGPRHRVPSRSDADLSTLVALSQRTATLRLAPATEPDPQFRADLRTMLVAAAEREGAGLAVAEREGTGPAGAQPDGVGSAVTARRDGVGSAAPSPAKISRRRSLIGRGSRARGAIIVGTALGALVVSGIAVASEDSMPGDALYGVKRSTERAELAFAGSDIGRGQLYLEFARTRLAEAKGVSGAAKFRRALDDMDSDTRQGVKLLTTAAVDRKDPAALDAVDAFVGAQQRDLGGVLDKVGGDSRDRLLSSLDLLERVANRSHQLRETLTCGITASDGSDALGPRPGSCSTGGSPTRPATGGQEPAKPEPTRGTGTDGTDRKPGPDPSKPAASASPAGAGASPEPPARSPAPSPTATPDAGGGLLGGLSRIIGDLLGG
jgi:hypothetical protein